MQQLNNIENESIGDSYGATKVEYVLVVLMIAGAIMWFRTAFVDIAQNDYDKRKSNLNYIQYQNGYLY